MLSLSTSKAAALGVGVVFEGEEAGGRNCLRGFPAFVVAVCGSFAGKPNEGSFVQATNHTQAATDYSAVTQVWAVATRIRNINNLDNNIAMIATIDSAMLC